jgi:predicted dehydrogenase
MNLGIIGSGLIVKEFLSISHNLTDIKILALLSRPESIQKNQILCDKYHIRHLYTDYSTLLSNPEIDTVYVALPNHLHFEFSLKALTQGKHVICEKPFTITANEAIRLKEASIIHNRMIVEAISTVYLQNYLEIKKCLLNKEIGDVKIITCNFSKISSRYEDFKANHILPVFDPKMYGGALMDLNCYNLHFVVGIFGQPQRIVYFPNISKSIDTSGVLLLDYPNFTCTCTAAKDSNALSGIEIQSDEGRIHVKSPSSLIESYTLTDKTATSKEYNYNLYEHRMVNTFVQITNMIKNNNTSLCHEMLDHSIRIVKILEEARIY